MIIEVFTAATAGSTILLGLAVNALRAQVRGLAKELKKKTIQSEKQQMQIWDLTAETKAEKDKAKTWEGRGTSAERDLRAALDQLFTLTEVNARRREAGRIRKANWRAKRKANNV